MERINCANYCDIMWYYVLLFKYGIRCLWQQTSFLLTSPYSSNCTYTHIHTTLHSHSHAHSQWSFSFRLSFYFSNTYAHCISFTHSNTHTHLISFINSSLWSHSLHNVLFILNSHHAYASLHLCPHIIASIRKSSTTTSGYNIVTICSILYLNYIIFMLCIFIWFLHLCLSREPYLFEAIRNVPKCSKYFALNIWTSSEMFRNISLSLILLSSSVGPLDTSTHSFYNHILSREPYLFETIQNVRNISLSILRQSTSINKSSLILYQ